MEKENKVVGFKQNSKFYIVKSLKEFAGGDIISAINYAQKALPLCKNAEKVTIYSSLSQYYRQIHMYRESIFYAFKKLQLLTNNPKVLSSTYLGIANIYDEIEDCENAKFYATFAQNACDDSSPNFEKAKKLDKEIKKKTFTLHSGNSSVEEAGINIGHRFFIERNFPCAVEAFESHSDLKNSQARSELILSYISMGEDLDKAKEVFEKYSEDTTEDICIGLILYGLMKDKKNYDKIKSKIVLNMIEPQNLFRLAVFLLTSSPDGAYDYKLALDIMERAFSYGIMTLDFQNLYAITLFNSGRYEDAKKEFITLKSYDVFNTSIYDYFLDKISSKTKMEHILFGFNIPQELYNNLKKEFGNILNYASDDLKEYFYKNEKKFYLIPRMKAYTYLSLLCKLQGLHDAKINEFIDYILLNSAVPYAVKQVLLSLKFSNQTYIYCSYGGKFVEYNFFGSASKSDSSKIAIKENNKSSFVLNKLSKENSILYEGVRLAFEYFLSNVKDVSIDFSPLKNENFFEIIYSKEDMFALASHIVFYLTKQNNLIECENEKVFEHFGLDGEGYCAFLEKYGLTSQKF